jgi:predicted HTH transcriptional regulator
VVTKPIEQIAKDDIEELVTNEVRESRTLDYKEALPGGQDNDRKEFLRDVISFANAGGGDVIFGVREQRDGDGKPTGIPESAPGLAGINADAEIRRLDDVVKNGAASRIAGLTPRFGGVTRRNPRPPVAPP